MNPERSGWPRWANVLLCIWVLAAGVFLGFKLQAAISGGDTQSSNERVTVASHPAKRLPVQPGKTPLLPATRGSNGSFSPGDTGHGSSILSPGAEASFAALESELSAAIGVSVAPLGSTRPTTLGTLQSGHAWSSFKVPILVTVMREQGSLSSEEMAQATAAVTASDNEAAAALFGRLGDPVTASAAVESTLAEAGYPTEVATAPPPSGAVSSWGQTEWPLEGSVYFYRALACGQLLGEEETQYVLGLMEEVISEQQWGLGEAGIPAQVAFKAGWGPDGSASGPYLVRQAGVLRSGSSGAVVTIAAQDDSGSFEAGVQDLDAVAGWVHDNVRLDAGTCAG
jgi:hypothetical protein